MPQLALQHTVPAAQVFLPHASEPFETHSAAPSWTSQLVPVGHSTAAHALGASETQSHTLLALSNSEPGGQLVVWLQMHTPPQSAPPLAGSQLSVGSSMHSPMPGQRN